MNPQSKFLVLLAFCAITLSACAPAELSPTAAPRPTASRAANPAAPAVTTSTQPGSVPTPTLSGPLALYDDKAAPFTVQYPRGWQIREEPESILFSTPDQNATLQIILYEYPEPAPSSVTTRIIFDRYVQNNTVKTTRLTTNADGSVSADAEFNDPGSRAAMQGLLRVWFAKNRRHHFIILFSATQDQFARWRSLGQSAVESFRER